MAAGKKLLFINRRGPYGSIYAQEALEIALVGAAFDQQISLALIDDGVFLLRPGQDTAALELKPFTLGYRALGDFEIHRVYVERESLRARGMDGDGLMPITTDAGGCARSLVEVVPSSGLSDIIAAQDILLNF